MLTIIETAEVSPGKLLADKSTINFLDSFIGAYISLGVGVAPSLPRQN